MKESNKTAPTFDEYASKVSNTPCLCGGYRTQAHHSARSDSPMVTIITVTYNAGQTLARTLASVRAQTYPNIEHIVIDGGSIDGTLSLIQDNEDAIAYWRSERDHGIYDAFNKGVVLAKGDYVGILNADDYFEPNQIETAVEMLLRTGAPFVHGDITMHEWRGLNIPLHGDPDYALKIALSKPTVFQVTLLCRMEVFKQYGLFLTRYLVAGDYEWLLRLTKLGLIGVHNPLVRAHIQAGGISTTRKWRAMWEAGHISWTHGLPVTRVVRLTLLRVMFPNGHQHVINRLKQLKQNPRQAVTKIVRDAFLSMRRQLKRAHRQVETDSLLDSFLSARQICSTIDPIGLEWLYGLALRSRTHAVYANWSEETTAVGIMLQAGGSEQVPSKTAADVFLCDHEHLQSIDLGKIMIRKTVLLLNSDLIPEDIREIPHLDFGMFLAYGAQVVSEFSTRRTS